jgi:hypothetical protein
MLKKISALILSCMFLLSGLFSGSVMAERQFDEQKMGTDQIRVI